MKKTNSTWENLTEHELQCIHGGGWFDDFKQGFKEGFDWATGVLKDLVAFLK
jgi:hypothetical protein